MDFSCSVCMDFWESHLGILEEAYTISQHSCQDCVDTFRNVTVIYVCPRLNMMRPICGNADDTTALLLHQNVNEWLSAPVSTLGITENRKVANLASMEGVAGRPNVSLLGKIVWERSHEVECCHEEAQHHGSISRDTCSWWKSWDWRGLRNTSPYSPSNSSPSTGTPCWMTPRRS